MARFEVSCQDLVNIAAQGGAPDALFELGMMYCAGHEVGVDLIEAHKWFNLAALRGNEDARSYRLEISREMSRAEIGQAQRRAREWLRQH